MSIIIHAKSIMVISPEMLITLKLIAWDENRSRHKDLQDIFFLLENYHNIETEAYSYTLDRHKSR